MFTPVSDECQINRINNQSITRREAESETRVVSLRCNDCAIVALMYWSECQPKEKLSLISQLLDNPNNSLFFSVRFNTFRVSARYSTH